MNPVKAGIIGCGNISDIYFHASKTFESIEVVACADLILERAKEKAAKHGVAKVLTVDKLLADPDIEIIFNLTIPVAHAEIALRSIEAGKHVYGEKPLGCVRAEGQQIMDAAKAKDVRVGCAPDTFMGGGIQTCRKLIDDGWIGEPIAATAFMQCHGHESWHPAPDFYYQVGGGPMFDMGPYYLTALVNLMGPFKSVSGSARVTFPERMITSQPKHGEIMKVNTPTHVAGTIDFANGAIGTVVMSFDVWAHTLPCIEIHGTEGSMIVPDPNSFGGPVKIMRPGQDGWMQVPLSHGYADNSRGLGAADMAYGIRSGRAHRASGDLAFHVLDAMQAFLDASDQGRRIEITSPCVRPAALPLGLRPGTLDA